MATWVGPTSGTEVNDLYVYSVFAGWVDGGGLPYRDFGFEYPPLALPAFYVPWRLGGDFEQVMSLSMLGWWLGAQALVARLGGVRAAWLMALSPVVCGALVRTHFDAVPVALTLGALLALVCGRETAGFVLLAVGGLVKLFPLVLVPLAAAWARSLRGVVLAVGLVVAGVAPFVVLGGFDFFLRFHLERPVQLESTPASVVFALGDPRITNTDEQPDEFKSNGLEDPIADVVQPAFTLLLLVVLALITLAARRRPGDPAHLVRCAFAAVLAFIALGKVLSPQYVLWLYPFAALALVGPGGGRLDRLAGAATLAAIALTQVWFPGRYFELVAEDPALIAVVAGRNALLLTALAATAAALARSPTRAPVAPGRTSPARP